MKVSILALASILISAKSDPCVVCPDGATAGDDYAPYADFGDPTTCSELIDTAELVETGTDMCAVFEVGVMGCCPAPVENPCIICPDGVTAADDLVPYAEMGFTMTCVELIEDYKLVESGSEYCQGAYLDEVYCCPTPAENPCILCPDGVTVGDDVAPLAEFGNPMSCSELVDFAALFESSSDICTPDIDEAYCCPTAADNPCTICPDGATAGDDFAPYSNSNMTCKELIDFAMSFETGTDMCQVSEADEALCCPPPAENPCIICPAGITAGDDYAPYESMGIPMTCSELVAFSALFESSSDKCTPDIDEAHCCPTAADNPCIICPNGATAGDDFAPYASLSSDETCKEIIEFTKNFETGSEYCELSELDESFCCPTVSENPCIICPGGITAGDDFVADFGGFRMTCKLLIDSLAHFDIESELCFQFAPYYEDACCPAGTTVDATTVIPVEETSTAATATAAPEEIDTGVSGEITTTASTLSSSNQSVSTMPTAASPVDLGDLTAMTPPASSSTSSPVSRFGGFAVVPVIVSALYVIAFA
jgi:hypothetical protein